MANKVKYGLKNVYYAVATESGGSLVYDTPVAWPGAVNLSLDQQGESSNFYADNIVYFSTSANNGYQGDFECALIPDAFRENVLGEDLDTKGFYVERSGQPTVEFALMFQFEGDESATRHCLYRCIANRPSVAGATVEESVEPQTETIQITAMPRVSDQVIKARCPYMTASTSVYQTWFSAVQEPTAV